jgi:formyl-CoA transferase
VIPSFSLARCWKSPNFLMEKSSSIPGIVPKLTLTPGETEWLGPELGEHTELLLGRLGYSPEDLVQLRNGGLSNGF